MKKIVISVAHVILMVGATQAQYWNTNGLNVGGIGNTFGTSDYSPIRIYTDGIQRALFTHDGSLNSWNGNLGDGLRILPPPWQ